jgi:hypothetical protein
LSNFHNVGSMRWRAKNVLWASQAEEQYVRIQRSS